MKPDYRLPARRPQAPSLPLANRLGARIAAWWRQRLARREERLQLATLSQLSRHLLQDIGVRDGIREHSEAIRDARHEQMAGWIGR